MKIVAVVPLRAGSKGLKGKNTRSLLGKPLYRYAVEQAVRNVGNCLVSTDIKDILGLELGSNCRPIERPSELANDSTSMDEVINHVLDTLAEEGNLPETILLLQATSPLRFDSDIREALDLYKSKGCDLVMSVTGDNASVLKYGFVENGEFRPISKVSYCFSNRQDLPKIYKPNGAVYVISVAAFLKNGGLSTESIGATVMPGCRSLDIDNIDDFSQVESLLSQRNMKF